MFTLFFTDRDVTDFDSAFTSNTKMYAKYFQQMLQAGIYLPPSQFEANFLSTKHTDAHLKRTIEALRNIKL